MRRWPALVLSIVALGATAGISPAARAATEARSSAVPVSRLSPAAAKSDLPLWELGLALAAGGAPDYPGAQRTRARVLPLPYGIYRGPIFEGGDSSDEAASRHKVHPLVSVDISLGGALPSTDGENDARRGMPGLDLLLELGPQLSIVLAKPSRASYYSLAVPLRLVLSAGDGGLNPRGMVFAPELSFTDGKFAGRGWNTRLSLGSTFASSRLAEYFYGVDPQYVTAERPAYNAAGGYLQTTLTAAISRAFVARTALFGFVRLSSQHGARNSASPLMQEDLNYSVGIGIAYTFLQSSRTVADRGDEGR